MKSMDYPEKIRQALAIQKKYLTWVDGIITKIGRHQNRFHPNSAVNAQAKNFVFAGAKLAGQILEALERGHLQLAVVGTRTLFEMSVNAVYIFNNPKKKNDLKHMRKICREIIRLANKKMKVNHTRIAGAFKERLREIGQGHLYHSDYRIMSDWTHLMSRTIFITADADKGKRFGFEVASKCLQALHNTSDAICEYSKFPLDPDLEKSVIAYCQS